MKHLIITFLTTISFTVTLFSQVGINTDSPNSYSVLEIVSDRKGVLIPRMTKDVRDSITGLSSTEQSLLIYNTSSQCYNLWNGTEWLNLCGSTPGVEYTMDCTSITTSPTLSELDPTTSLNGDEDYVEVTITVTTPGPLSLTTNVENGYYFTYSGTITETGEQTIKLQGSGKPINYDTTSTFKISGVDGCTFTATSSGLSTRTINVLFLAASTAYVPSITAYYGLSNMNTLLTNTALFGNDGSTSGIVGGFQDIVITTINYTSSTGRTTAISYLKDGSDYDIVVLGWESDGLTDTTRADLVSAVQTFLAMDKKAGLFLYTQDSETYAKLTNSLLTGTQSTVTGIQSARTTSTTVNGKILTVNNTITNGPFGDLRGLAYTSFDDGLYFNSVVGTNLARENSVYSATGGLVQTVAFIPSSYSNVVVHSAFNFGNNQNDSGGGDAGIFIGDNFFNCASSSASNYLYSNMGAFNSTSQGDQTKINTAFNLNVWAYLIGLVL